MVKVYYGKKGTGKTKHMLESANGLVLTSKGNVIYIDDSDELRLKLDHSIRFVNILDYPVKGADSFLGFICGVASQNYDIETIFIDGLTYIVEQSAEELSRFFKGVDDLSERHNVDFYMSINGDEDKMPEFIKKYL